MIAFSDTPLVLHTPSVFPFEKEQGDVAVAEEVKEVGYEAQIIVYNDDVNTFDWVIECFMEVLQHSAEQAEQLAILIHYKGKASVKVGTYEGLVPYKDALTERGLSAVIEGA